MIIPHVVVIDINAGQTANGFRQLQCLVEHPHIRVSATQPKRDIIVELKTSSADAVFPFVFRLPKCDRPTGTLVDWITVGRIHVEPKGV